MVDFNLADLRGVFGLSGKKREYGFDIDTYVFRIDTCLLLLDDMKLIQLSDIIVFTSEAPLT